LRAKRVLVAVVAMVVAAGLVVGVVSGAFSSLASSGLYATGLWSSNGPSTLPPGGLQTTARATSPTPHPTPSASPTVRLPRPVLASAEAAKVDGSRLRAKIKAVKVKKATGSYSGSVVDVGTGKVLFDHDARTAKIPASTMKLLTSAAALSILGPEHTFTTKVVSPKSGRIILVGGGDPYLAKKTTAATYPQRASIADLARATAASLKKRKVKRVSLGYDATLFTGPAYNPIWPSFYSDQASKTSALWVDEGRVNGGSPGPRVADPARDAADAFAAALAKRGVKVTKTSAAKARKSAARIASVSSMPVERIVERLLMVSDNDAAEVMFRQAAIGAGKSGSIANGKTVVRAELRKLGIWDRTARINDGSGLARQTKVPADTMVKLLRLAASDKHPELRGVITGLPVAGVEGSLRVRFFDEASLAGRGLVRAKTGTLNKVHTLAGYVRTRDGSLMVFAFLINNPANDYAATIWLDRVTAAISTCGCR
jgi:D-alanyl-D-alanine carboxypeptidase/D-alanyl-D-alanine-endopeptidase (penicillin-binding protein 4)